MVTTDGHSTSSINCIFISDFFTNDLPSPGGGELSDAELIQYLESKSLNILKVRCQNVTERLIKENNFFIISNHVSLNPMFKKMLENKRYVIYEHDHKYVSTRDPSKFTNFVAPKSKLVNISFYVNAETIICKSKIHEEVIRKNLGIQNTKNIGCCLWDDKKFETLKKLQGNEKTKKVAVVESSNPTKGTKPAVQYCNNNNIDFDLISSNNPVEFLEILSQYETLVFIPQVLESFNRLCVEAKMLNCKVVTKPQLLGAASEEWFQTTGTSLIDVLIEKRNAAFKLIEGYVNNTNSKQEDGEITVILNAYRRPHLLEEQIKRVRSQSIKPKQVWIWVNDHEDLDDFDFSKLDADRIFRNDFNWKFYGRFAGALLADTEYVAMFDDDTMPGDNWFKNCLNEMSAKEGIMGGIGIELHKDDYGTHDRFGWATFNESVKEVDLVGHAWFFKRDWLQYLWREKPFMWDNGEDIQFSYLAQKYGNINTYVPPHPKDDPSKSSSLKGYEYGVDSKATSTPENHNLFYPQRDACVRNAISNGWKTVRMRSK
jgi:hypothetical protein